MDSPSQSAIGEVTTAVILVGHGAVAKDCPRDLVVQLKTLEGRRHATQADPTAAERELDQRIRSWPRTPETDPYQAGCEALAASLRPLLNGALFKLAYLEFCAPTLAEVVAEVRPAGVSTVLVIPSMLTPGGVHSEVDIPEILDQLRLQYPDMEFRYAWPFDLGQIAGLLATHLQNFAEIRPA